MNKKQVKKNFKVKCSQCKEEFMYYDSEHRPFCSERCRLIDLGEWADGNRAIPSDAEHDDVTAADLDRD